MKIDEYMDFSVDCIDIRPEGRYRPINKEKVAELAASMAQVGLINPVMVWSPNEQEAWLIAGHHRLEAAKSLGWDKIPALVIYNSDIVSVRLAEIAENLHRAELTALERATHVAEWVRLTEEQQLREVSSQVETKLPKTGAGQGVGGGRPEGGINAAVRELGIDRNAAHRSVKIAETLTPEAKAAAVGAGLDDNQSALLKVAAAPAADQVAMIEQIAELKKKHAAELAREKAEAKAKADAASRREEKLIADRNEALADKKRAIEAHAAAEKRIDQAVEQAAKEAWEEADEKYKTRLKQLARERDEAKAIADQRAKVLATAVANAKAEAEQAALAQAELLAAKAMESRKGEVDKLEKAAERAQINATKAYEAEQRAKKSLEEHQAQMAQWASSEAELAEQVKFATDISEFIGSKMAELGMYEQEPHTAAIGKLRIAAQLCEQFAQALNAFISPQLAAM